MGLRWGLGVRMSGLKHFVLLIFPQEDSCVLASSPSSSHLPSKNVDAVMLGAAVFHNTYDRVVALGDVLRNK